MGTKTGIEWTDSTWSPIRVRVKADAAEIARAKGYTSLVQIAEKMAGRLGQHCEHVSPGCEHCYAESHNHRCLPGNGTGLPYDRRSRDLIEAYIDEKVLMQPFKWKPRRIFVQNQSDLFAEWVTDEMRDMVYAAMALCPQHTFQMLTKRAKAMRAYLSAPSQMLRWGFYASAILRKSAADRAPKFPLPNVWHGVSAENQDAADERIPLLLQTPSAVRFVSCEPLLRSVNLREVHYDRMVEIDTLTGDHGVIRPLQGRTDLKLDWVICGGESGHGARPMEAAWAQSLRDQCAAAGTAFFMKQMGSAFGPNKGHELPPDLDIKQFPEVALRGRDGLAHFKSAQAGGAF